MVEAARSWLGGGGGGQGFRMGAGVPVSQAQDGFTVSQAPPAEAANQPPVAVAHTGVEPVWWGEGLAVGGREGDSHAANLTLNRRRRGVGAHGRKRPGMAVVAGNEVKEELAVLRTEGGGGEALGQLKG